MTLLLIGDASYSFFRKVQLGLVARRSGRVVQIPHENKLTVRLVKL